MSRRKLSKQQIQRVDDNAQEDQLSKGRVVARYASVAHLRSETSSKIIKAHIPGKIHGLTRGDDIVVGDWVAYSEPQGNRKKASIEKRFPPETLLVRYPRSFGDRAKNVAANIQQLIIVIAPKPSVSRLVIDEYLLAANTQGIQPLILSNKSDLSEAKNENYQTLLKDYQDIGFQVLNVSSLKEDNLEPLRQQLAGTTSVFMGTSGVGKSSLLNALVGEEIATTNTISESAELGQHTTTTAILHYLPNQTEIIDAPGIREFRLDSVDLQTLRQAYPELHIKTCQFNNCSHLHEPKCGVQEVVKERPDLLWRYENYCQLHQNLVVHSTDK